MTILAKTPTVLAFERKLDISDAVFYQSNSQNKNQGLTDVKIREKSVRGTISNRLKNAIANDPAKLDAEIEKANLQKVDVAMLDTDKDTLIAKWTCKILPFTGGPNVCNNQDYQAKVIETVKQYVEVNHLEELARRYAINIVNARWLWRNKLGAENIDVIVNCTTRERDEILEFKNVNNCSLNEFSSDNNEIRKLAELIQDGLLGNTFIILEINAVLKVGYGQEVYPSQELILDKGHSSKSKVLYQVDGKIAGMHSQKIGNAIRTIDTWYSDDVKFPIAVEPYGSVTTLGTAFRQPKQKNDFYSLFDNWILKDVKPDVEQQHYVMAVLIRGGVFGESGKDS